MIIIGKAIYELLKGLAGGNVYALRAPDGAKGPFIIYQTVDSGRWDTMNNKGGIAQATIQVDAYAGKVYDAKQLGLDIENILNKYRGTLTISGIAYKIAGISLENEYDEIDETDSPLLFRNSATYIVTYYQ